jgi:glycosyltransferase involved in cell wall biosynthesis
MRVAVVDQPISSFAPPDDGGSISTWIYEVGRRLPPTISLTVFARLRPGDDEKETVENIFIRRVSVKRDLQKIRWHNYLGKLPFPYTATKPFFASESYYRDYANRVADLIQEGQFDLVHLHNFSQFIPIIKKTCPEIRIILHMHCDWLRQLDRNVIESRLCDATRFIGCSEYITDGVRKRFPAFADKGSTIYNGFDSDRFSPDPNQNKDNAGKNSNLLFVGRITPEKGLHDLIEAFAAVNKAIPETTLMIIGPHWVTAREFILDLSDDPNVKNLKKYYRGHYPNLLRRNIGYGLRDRVHFKGLVAPSQLPDYYRKSAILISPSISEAFGMPLVEAMGCGIPVVCTNVGGMPEIAEDGVAGRLVAPGDPQELAEVLIDLLKDGKNLAEFGERGRDCALKRFTWDKIADKLMDEYGKTIV